MDIGHRWYIKSLPGFLSIGIVVIARLTGVLQSMEWDALDTGLRWRWPEPTDKRIVIVGIDEIDIQTLGTYPIPDGVIAQLLQKLQTYNPRAIGLDLVRDIPVNPGHDSLIHAFQTMPNVIGSISVVPDPTGGVILPPPALPSDQIGFVDAMLDDDGYQRRSLLGATDLAGDYRFSMAIQLARLYLKSHTIDLENGVDDPVAMRFGTAELPVVHPNTGGYVGADAKGNQTLIYFRSGPHPFRTIALREVLNDHVNPDWLKNNIVLIGVTAKSTKDYAQSAAINTSTPGLVFGVDIHAHTLSQILSAALDGRSLLRSWPDLWEYAWIIAWGLIGIAIGQWIQRPSIHFLVAGCMVFSLVAMCYISLMVGWWLPIVPALIVLTVNSIVLHSLYLYNRSIQSRIRDRQLVIEQTFTAIHNGPLQTLAQVLRELEEPTVSQSKLHQDLTHLNQELRGVYDAIQKDAVQDNRLHLQGSIALDLTAPLHEILYEVYNDTLNRDFPHFAPIQAKIIKFEPFKEQGLTPDHKRNVCRFLEESLCNVGKHAVGARRLSVECRYDGHQNLIQVIDNGNAKTDASSSVARSPSSLSISPSSEQRGTQQARQTAAQLGGRFVRSPHSPKGTCCTLTWHPRRSLWGVLKPYFQSFQQM